MEKLFDSPEVYRIEVPLPGSPLKELNAYLIRSEGESLLVDTGFRNPVCRKALEDGLNELHVDRSTMRIFLTHMHSDHIGSVIDIAEPTTTIYMSETDYNLYYELRTTDKWKESDADFLREGFPKEELDTIRSTNPSRIYAPEELFIPTFVKDDTVLWVGSTECICIDTKGHTPGHMCLYLPNQQIMVLGDHVLFNISPNITNWLDTQDSLGDYLASLDKIIDYPVTLPLPGHRGVTKTMKERIIELKEHHNRRLEQMVHEITENPGMTAYEIASHATWHMHGATWENAPKNQKWFAVGETIAHLDYLRLRGAIYRHDEDGIWLYYR